MHRHPGRLVNADNDACQDGFCVWTGCRDTAECRDGLMNDAYVCTAVP